MEMSRSQVGEKLHFHVGIKTHFDVDIYIMNKIRIKRKRKKLVGIFKELLV